MLLLLDVANECLFVCFSGSHQFTVFLCIQLARISVVFFCSRMFYSILFLACSSLSSSQSSWRTDTRYFFSRSLLTYFNVIRTNFSVDDNDKYQPNKTSFIFIVEITKKKIYKKLVALVANDDVITLHTIASEPILQH